MDDKIIKLLEQILYEIQSLKFNSSNEEWLNASAFCRKFGISRPTLKSRVQKGLIEKRNFDEKFSRYKWKENDNV